MEFRGVEPPDATPDQSFASPAYAKACSFAVSGLLDAFHAQGHRTRDVLDGLSLPMSKLRDPSAQMDWDDFLLLLERLKGLVGGEDAMEECAFQLILTNPMIRGLASAFPSPRQIILKIPAFMGGSLYTHISCHARPIGEDQILFQHTIPVSCKSSPVFLRMSRGLLRAYPCLLGFPEAQVHMNANANAHQTPYRITLPERPRACAKSSGGGPQSRGDVLFVASGESDCEKYLDIFNDPGGNLARIRYLTTRLSDHSDLTEFVQDLMRLLKEIFGCTYARLWLYDTSRGMMNTLASFGSCPEKGLGVHELTLRGRTVGRLDVDRATSAMPPFTQIIGTLIPFISFALAQCAAPTQLLGEEACSMARREQAFQTFVGLHRFTKREQEILHQLGRGLTSKEIAQAFGTSPRTIENQVAGMLRKTQSTSRLDLVSKALG